MDLAPVEIVIGIVFVAVTVIDVFGTVVVPGRVRIGLRIPRAIQKGVLPVWRAAASRLQRGEGGTIGSSFAAFLLFCVFSAWVLVMMLGLAVIVHGLRRQFAPPLDGFGDALFQTGSAMMTLGLNGPQAQGWARAVVILSGICGLQVVTLTLTYIVQLQMALQSRDPLVLRLAARAGTPPSGLQLLLTHHRLELDRDLAAVFDRWEEWCAVLEQTHRAHPVLSYFRTGERHTDWVAALGAVLDAASLVHAGLAAGPKGNAELLLVTGSRAVRQLCGLLGLSADQGEDDDVHGDALEEVWRRLKGGGCALHPLAEMEAELRSLRCGYGAGIRKLADHFGVEGPPFVPSREDAPLARSRVGEPNDKRST